MSRRGKMCAIANLHAMMTAIWDDVRKGKTSTEKINVEKYATMYHVGKFKRSLIIPYINQKCCPTQEQASKLRKEISMHINNRPKPQQKVKIQIIEPNLFSGIDEAIASDREAIAECISYLKSAGYVVFKKV